MFYVSCAILVLSFLAGLVIPIVYLLCSKDLILANYLSLILPELLTFFTSFMVIPKIITNYLFNKDEEKYMSQIISNTQKFDSNLYSKKR